MIDQTSGENQGLLSSLKTFTTTLVAIIYTRLKLLSTELEVAWIYWLSLLVMTLVALFCLMTSIVLATILLVVTFWYTHRLLVLGSLAGLFLTVGLAMWAYLVHKVKTKPRVFSASLSELLKDHQQLDSKP